jgi:branched-chain amino acid transport system permease protein
MLDITILTQAIVSGILMGAIYSLVSLGLTMIFGVVRIVNFAHGEFLMIGMYATYFLWARAGIDPLIAILITGPLLFLIGAGIYKSLLQRVAAASDFSKIFLTVGISLVLQNIALLIFTANYWSVKTSYEKMVLSLWGISISYPRLIGFLGAVILSFLISLFLLRTDLGKAMRAVAQNREVAMLMGINPERVYVIAVGLGSAVAGVTGYFYVFPLVGVDFIVMCFAVAITGGLGNIKGTLLCGPIFGIAESLGILFIGADSGMIVAFLILILVLIFRPSGLLGEGRL